MPVLLFGMGILALGAGLKFAGDGVEDTADGLSKLIVVGTLAGGTYLVAKKMKVI